MRVLIASALLVVNCGGDTKTDAVVAPDAAVALADERIEVEVDPNVELLGLLSRLAGYPEYNEGVPSTPFIHAADAWFETFADHDAVLTAHGNRTDHQVGFNAPASLAVHLDSSLQLRVPLSPYPERLDYRWRDAPTSEFLEEVRRFHRDADFGGFWRQWTGYSEQVEGRYRELFAEQQLIEWFDNVFGEVDGATYVIRPGLFEGRHNYGNSVRTPDGTLEFHPVLGIASVDDEALPVLDQGDVLLAVHEIAHVYVNPLFEAHAADLEVGASAAFAHVADEMRRRAYPNWQYMANESGVRACEVLYAQNKFGEKAAEVALVLNRKAGFEWIGPMSEALDKWIETHDAGDMAGFPAVAGEVMAEWAADPTRAAVPTWRGPKVVKTIPETGAAEVSPLIDEIRVEFDQPMRTNSWSWVRHSDGNFPNTMDSPRFLSDQVAVLPVRLEANHYYQLSVNSITYRSFKGLSGESAVPYVIEFTTGTLPDGVEPPASMTEPPPNP
ncbi:MAG: DUF4932 domain-containing protein [Proteobacteria bacterium]|nr:DUF4932 domain-containing protein [Pseudomonadota bacterium]